MFFMAYTARTRWQSPRRTLPQPIVMAHIVMAYIVMAYTVVAYIGMAYDFYGLHNTNSVAVTATNTAPATSARTVAVAYSHGLYKHCVYSCGLHSYDMAYMRMAYIVVAYIVVAYTARTRWPSPPQTLPQPQAR